MKLNIRGRLIEWSRPLVMGIMNVTPDSFYAGSRIEPGDETRRARRMLQEGCDIIDVGACSSRPGARNINPKEERVRLLPVIRQLRKNLGDEVVISVDTYDSNVAEAAIEAGADIINDISGGDMDPAMFPTVARLKVPYILMHMRGNPRTMDALTDYDDVTADVIRDLAGKVDTLRQAGVADVIIDPGFGFAKTRDQNFRLLSELRAFRALGCPILAGMSRKRMVREELGINAEEALNGTTALNMAALMNGADILRVHDVKEASQTVRLFEALDRNRRPERRVVSTDDKATGDYHLETF